VHKQKKKNIDDEFWEVDISNKKTSLHLHQSRRSTVYTLNSNSMLYSLHTISGLF